jgi:SNF2 family DNA or RNA helicase
VLQNWANELNKFAPDLTFKKLYGSRSERQQFFADERVLGAQFDVYLTT